MTKITMQTVSLAEAKAHLSHLVEQVEMGEEILITKHGKVAAKITSVPEQQPAMVPVAELLAFHKKLPKLCTSSASLIRKIRNEGY